MTDRVLTPEHGLLRPDYVAHGFGYSGLYHTRDEAEMVVRANGEGDVFVRISELLRLRAERDLLRAALARPCLCCGNAGGDPVACQDGCRCHKDNLRAAVDAFDKGGGPSEHRQPHPEKRVP